MFTVLVAVYRGSGRTSKIEILFNEDKEEIDRLVNSFEYTIVATDKSEDYDYEDAWEEFG